MELAGKTVKTTARNEHIPEIERDFRNIKKRVRVMTNTLPFEQLPHQLKVEIASNAVSWLNCFPYKN